MVTGVSGSWEMLTELNATCWRVCKARGPVWADGLQFAWKDHCCLASHLPEKGKLLKPWEIAPEWESHGLLNPCWEMLLVRQFLKDTGREGGEAFSLRKERGVSEGRNRTAATKWSNFCMMLLFPGLYRCGTFFTSCSAAKCTCLLLLFYIRYRMVTNTVNDAPELCRV